MKNFFKPISLVNLKMALIRSKLHLAFPKSFIKPFSSRFSTVLESTKNPNFSEDDEKTHETDANISSNITPQENPVVEGLHLLITDHYRRNPNVYQNPNCNFTISSLAQSFSQVSSGECVSSSVVVSVIEKCRSVRHDIPFPQALAFFNWAVGQGHNVEIFKQGFVETVDLAGKAKEFDVAWGLIDEMKSRKLEIPSDIFVRLIKRYVRAGMISEAIHAFNRMEEYGCSPDSAAISAVIAILVKKKKAVEAQSFFDGLKDRFELDVVVYTNLVSGWCTVGNISEAERVFGEMKTKGIVPNVYTYTIVIDGLCRHGQISRAHDVLSEMIEKGFQPNAATFNSLMRVHVKARKTEKVLQVYNQMKKLGCQPDAITYSFLIDCQCRNGNRDDAMKLIDQMVNKGIVPSVHSFNLIFSCIVKARDVNAADKLFAMMKELKCQPNTVTYNVLMKMFVELKSTDKVFKLKKEMDELEVELNVNTYSNLISMFCAMGHWSDACKYFKEMIEEKNLRPSTHLYEMVLKQLKNAGHIKKREELVDMMVERGFADRPI
ncbi:pentatricopeptide repeat-containing protein At1g20300, mitochondrial-like [Silene latifolia]|uniref:pentatricopeptide repeat-containing protein At1g20300, mitochondrial-like n=1 Tax=Silene latifolia TaxID=37657 RepID=UPI003D78270A